MNMRGILSGLGLMCACALSACGTAPSDADEQHDGVLSSPLPLSFQLTTIKMNGRSTNAALPVNVTVTFPGLATTTRYIGDYSGRTVTNTNTQFNCSSLHVLPGSDGYCTANLPLNTTVGSTQFTGMYPANTSSKPASVRINGTTTNFTIDSTGKSSQTCATTWMFINNIIDGDKITVCWKSGLVVPFIEPPMIQTIFYPAPGELSQVGLQQQNLISTKTDWTYSDSFAVGVSASVNIKGAKEGSWDSQQAANGNITFQSSSTYGTAETITTGTATSFMLPSKSMFPDPDEDLFSILVGANATLTNYHDGTAPLIYIDMASGTLEWVKLGWMKGLAQNPQVISPDIPVGNVPVYTKWFPPLVAQTLLKEDPFASSQPIAATIAANPKRFVPASPAHLTLTRLISQGFQQINAKQTDQYTSQSTGDSMSWSIILGVSASDSTTLTITHSNINQSTASINLQTTDPCIEGTVDLYLDTALGTIVPVPHLEDSCHPNTNLCPDGSTPPHVLLPGQSLSRGQTLTSCGGTWTLTLQQDGTLAEYYNDNINPPLLVTSFYPPGATTAVMQTNGDFVLKDANGNVLTDSGTSSTSGAYFILEENGFLAIYNPQASPENGTGGALPALWTLAPGG